MPTLLRCVSCGYELSLTPEAQPHLDVRSISCPKCGDLVETVSLNGSNIESVSAETLDTPARDHSVSVKATLPVSEAVAGYEIQEVLGRGGMGVVYRAHAQRLGRVVALKTLYRMDPTALQRFKQEFRVLADVSHPNLVTLHELVSDGQSWFFSMELVDGVDFLTYVSSHHGDGEEHNGDDRAEGSLPLMKLIRIRRAMAQLCSAVAALHQAGVLHRDIKPSNVLVTPEERLVLLDFGLAAEMEGAGYYLSTDANVVGTVAYMSPEQAASEPVSEASDWYSVGVMLYQALTGVLPFAGKPLEVLQKKQQTEPQPPNAVARGVPEDLAELCIDILRVAPADRPSAEQILQRLSAHRAEAHIASSRQLLGDETTLLVGRDEHLAQLDACYRDMERGRPVVLFAHGYSGMGKTALVHTFLKDVRQRQKAVVLAGRCYEQESVPFKALDSLIDSLSHYLRHAPQGEAEGLMPRDIQALTRVFPVLGRVEATHSAARRTLSVSDQQELRRRAIAALREMLARLGDRHPLILHIDDLQWGDVDSASMLYDLLKPPDAPLLMFVGSYRAEDAQTSPFLIDFWRTRAQSVQQLDYRELAVNPLPAKECRRLALQLIGRDDDDAQRCADIVARESGGSPLFVRELARFLTSAKNATSTESVDLESMIVGRVADLSPETQRLLKIVVVAGKPMPQQETLRAAGLEATGPSLLAHLKAEHLIRGSSAGEQINIETYHDRIREAMLASLTDDELKDTHRCWAEAIESWLDISPAEVAEMPSRISGRERSGETAGIAPDDWQLVFDLAFHRDACGEHERALPYALVAAEQARAQHSLEIAEQQFRIAQRGAPSGDAPAQFRISEGLGDVLMLRGRYEEAQEMYLAAQEASRGDVPAVNARIEGKLGELAFKRGYPETASRSIERGLRLLGRPVPRNPLSLFSSLVWEVLVQILHTLWPRLFVGRRDFGESKGELVAIKLYSRLAYAYWFTAGKIPCLWTHLRHLNLAERYPSSEVRARAWAEHGPVMSLVPFYDRAFQYLNNSLEIRRDLGNTFGQAQTQHYLGIVFYAASRFSECIENCRDAVRLFDQTGDFWELNMARYQLAASLYRQGDLAAAIEEAQRMHRSGLDLEDVQASGLAVDILAKAAVGRIPADVVQAELCHQEKQLEQEEGHDAQTHSQVLQAEGVRLMAESNFSEAAEIFERGFEIARQAGTKNTYVIPCLPWLATALRSEAERIRDSDPAGSKRLLRRARSAARRGQRLARKFQNDLPHALRENGLVLMQQGRHRKARRFLEESLAIAEGQEARYEQNQTRLALAHLGVELDQPGAKEQVATAAEALRKMENIDGIRI